MAHHLYTFAVNVMKATGLLTIPPPTFNLKAVGGGSDSSDLDSLDMASTKDRELSNDDNDSLTHISFEAKKKGKGKKVKKAKKTKKKKNKDGQENNKERRILTKLDLLKFALSSELTLLDILTA